MTDILPAALAFLFGACVGSFLNVCIARWPAGQSVVAPRSRCPQCGHAIAWYENVPLVSWLALRGRCRGCRNPISPIYPLVELTVAAGWLAAFLAFGPSFSALRVAVFGTLLLGIAVTDARHYLIPDGFTVFGVVWCVGTAALAAVVGDASPFAGLYDALVGACAGAGAIAIAGWLGEVALKREAMGFGDVTLMAVVGAAVGPGRALLTVFLGALLGAAGFLCVVYPLAWLRQRRLGTPREGTQLEIPLGALPFEPPLVPFGVFLAPAALVTLLWGRELVDWYVRRVLLS